MREARLFRFFCTAGAYNLSHIYYLHKELAGCANCSSPRPTSTSAMSTTIRTSKVDLINVAGFLTVDQLVNSSYDAATLSITSHNLWRGIGDASSSGLWIFRDGEFSLVKFDVDASYDGEINPQTVVDYDTAP